MAKAKADIGIPHKVTSGQRRRVLHYGAGVSLERVLLGRLGIVLVLLLLVVGVFWFDREGLRDHSDGHISFSDVLYFAMVTVSTIGYGDIVPVSPTSRLIDAFAVTPIRLFIWFIFLGTAYEFVIQKIIEDYRMSKLQQKLQGHLVLCGFGHSGWIAAQESVSKGTPPGMIVAIDHREDRVRLAADNGYVGLAGDATSEELLDKACVGQAKAVIVSMGRDDTTILVILTLRSLSKTLKIVASIREQENLKLAKLSGADHIVSPPLMGGYLLANAIETDYAAPFLSDLMSVGGHMELSERKALPDEIGKSMTEIEKAFVIQVFHDGNEVPLSRRKDYKIQTGDTLLIVNSGTGHKL